MNGPKMRLRLGVLTCLGVAVLAIAGCRNSVPVSNDDDYATGRTVGRDQGSLAGGDGFSFSSGDQGKKGSAAADAGSGALGVNAYLWRGALDTLSFMPLSSADPFGGVIITDWYQPPAAAGERFKATAYILGRQLRADGVKVALFRQVQQSGQWVDAPVSAGTSAEVENKVLARARELRAQSGS
jgi:hypothetical protein